MSFRIFFQDEAIIDIQDANDWYEEQLAGLGEEFPEELNGMSDRLKQNPQYFGFSFDEFRDAGLKRFPYLAAFKIERNKIYSNSARHTAGDPGPKTETSPALQDLQLFTSVEKIILYEFP